MELPISQNIAIDSKNEQVIVWLSQPNIAYDVVLSPIAASNHSFMPFWSILPWLYIAITLYFLARSIGSLALLKRLKSQSVEIKKYWFKLFKTSHSSSFSFFSNVFIPKTLFESDDFDQVLAHECVHVKQHHSVDRLLLDFVVSLFWFNPFIYLYRNALIEIHEFQADEFVVNRFKDPIRYQEILFSQLQTPQYSGMVSHFNFSMIKKRIVMMNKQKKKSGWIYAIILPVTLLMIFAFSSKDTVKPIEIIGAEMAGVMEPNDFEFPKFNFSKQDFEPSILPLKSFFNVRMTSGFGKRMHPILKVEKMHNGVDFSCRTGSKIIAAGDGIVDEVETNLYGYGKMISINHDDNYQTRYAQLSEFLVKKGDHVKKGQLIGLSGNSGASTAPHLHYEVIELGKGFVDPIAFIKNYEFEVQSKDGSLTNNDEDSKKRKDKEKEKSKDKKQTFKVIIDPGHGGEDSGEIFNDGITEKELALMVAEYVKGEFKNQEEFEIILTRELDKNISYSDRQAEAEDADLFISLHSKDNSDFLNTPFVIMYSQQNFYFDRSKEIAAIIHNEFKELNNGDCSMASFSNDCNTENEYELIENVTAPAILLYFDASKSMETIVQEKNIASLLVKGIKLASL